MDLPGGAISARPLHFILIVDCSGSMSGSKIGELNTAIREALPHMCAVAAQNPNAKVLVRAVRFSDGAQWHTSQPTDVAAFHWTDLTASGETQMGRALVLVADALKMSNMPERALPPVLVLVSDGSPTDDFDSGLQALMNEPWGKKAVRIAIGIGSDARDDVLRRFIGNIEISPLRANNAEELVSFIRWATTAVVGSVSRPATHSTGQVGAPPSIVRLPLPPPPNSGTPGEPGDVW